MIKNKNSVAGDSVALAFVKLITSVLGLLTTRILCGFLSKSDYGTYSQVLLLISSMSSITILGMTDGINYYYNNNKGHRKGLEYISTIFFMQLIVSLVGMLVITLISPRLIIYFKNDNLKSLLVFVYILPFMQNLISMLQVLFISIGEAKKIAYRNLIISVSNLILFTVSSYYIREVYILLLFTTILNGIQIVYFSSVLFKSGIVINAKKIKLYYIKGILKYCIPMAMFIMTNALSRDLDKYVVSAFTNAETLAMYSNASKILPFDIVMTSFVTVLLPVLTRILGEKQYIKAQKVYSSFLMISYLSTVILAAGIIPVASNAMCFLYSEKYVEGTSIFVIYIIIDIIRFMGLSLVLSATGNSAMLMRISLVSLGANAILNVILFKIFGVIGPAIATLVVMLGAGMVTLKYSSKAMNSTILRVFNIKELLKKTMVIVMICMVEYVLSRVVIKFFTNNFIILAICYGFYLMVTLLIFKKSIIYYYKELNNI